MLFRPRTGIIKYEQKERQVWDKTNKMTTHKQLQAVHYRPSSETPLEWRFTGVLIVTPDCNQLETGHYRPVSETLFEF